MKSFCFPKLKTPDAIVMPKSKHTKKQKEAAQDWAKLANDANFVLVKMSGKLASETLSKMISDLYEQTEENVNLCNLAISYIADKELRKNCEAALREHIFDEIEYFLSAFPKEVKPDKNFVITELLDMTKRQASFSGYFVEEEVRFYSAISGLWEGVNQDQEIFDLAISHLTNYQQRQVANILEQCKGNLDLISSDRRQRLLLNQLVSRGYKIKSHDFFESGWKIKRPKLFSSKFEIVGLEDLEDSTVTRLVSQITSD